MMNLTETINYICAKWPEVYDAQSCAYWILSEKHNGPEVTIDELISFWSRHEHD